MISIRLIALWTWIVPGISLAFLTSSGSSCKWSTLPFNPLSAIVGNWLVETSQLICTAWFIEVMDWQILLGYWANCEGVSIIQWPDFTFLNTRFFIVPQIPFIGPFVWSRLLQCHVIVFSNLILVKNFHLQFAFSLPMNNSTCEIIWNFH